MHITFWHQHFCASTIKFWLDILFTFCQKADLFSWEVLYLRVHSDSYRIVKSFISCKWYHCLSVAVVTVGFLPKTEANLAKDSFHVRSHNNMSTWPDGVLYECKLWQVLGCSTTWMKLLKGKVAWNFPSWCRWKTSTEVWHYVIGNLLHCKSPCNRGWHLNLIVSNGSLKLRKDGNFLW